MKEYNLANYGNEKESKFYTSVVVLNAGGTINMGGISERRTSGRVREIIKNLYRLLKRWNIDVIYEDVFNRAPDSSNIGEEEWEILFNKIKDVVKKKSEIERLLKEKGIKLEKGGIVVTHGTDTMEVTSLIISFQMKLIENNFPIIFTGSHTTIEEPNSDALNNLKKAIIISKEKFNRNINLPPGVFVTIGKDIHLASRLTKVYSKPDSDGKYFFSFPAPVGQITGNNIKVDSNYLNVLLNSKVDLKSINRFYTKSWGVVEHIVLDRFSSPEIINDFLKRYYFYKSEDAYKNREVGLIIQGNFINNPNLKKIIEILQKIDSMHVPIFLGSKKTYEYIINNSEKPYDYLGLIHKSLSHSKARTKLTWLLRFSLPIKEIVRLMTENVAGEIYDTDKLPEWINYETFPDQINGVEVFVIYPNINPRVAEDAIKRLDRTNTRKKLLYLFGFGDGHIPTINKPIKSIIEDFLRDKLNVNINLKLSNIEELITELSNIMEDDTKVRGKISDYLKLNYRVDRERLNKEILYLKLEDIRKNKYEEIRKQIENVFRKFEKNQNFKIKNKVKTREYFLNEIKFEIPYTYLQQTKNEINNLLLSNAEEDIKRYILYNYPILVIKRLIKDAIINYSILLKILGNAVDNGVDVHIKSQAVRAKTDTNKYEVGIMLKCIGVKSDATDGWNITYLSFAVV